MQNKFDKPICSGFSPREIEEGLKPLLNFAPRGLSLEKLTELINNKLVPHLMQYDHPGFLSMFNAFPEEGALLGGNIALKYNQGVTNWQVSPGGAVLEELCCSALCKLFGLSADSEATFMYSGTYANQQALYLALYRTAGEYGFDYGREGLRGFKDPAKLKVLTSEDAHFSVKHAVRMLGLGDESIVELKVDSNRRIDLESLKNKIKELKGKIVFCFIATAGTTPTGSIDPLEPILHLCRKTGTWLHVDGAYGLAYSLVPEYKAAFRGIEQADSICWDPHKQLAVPIPNSLLFVKKRENFYPMALHSHYFNRKEAGKPNPGLKSPPSTRPLAALSLITSLLHQGMEKVIERLRAPLASIRTIYDLLKKEEDLELKHKPDTGIICFRFRPPKVPEVKLEELQNYIFSKIIAERRFSISVTRLDDQTVLRLLSISPGATAESMKKAIDRIRQLGYAYLRG